MVSKLFFMVFKFDKKASTSIVRFKSDSRVESITDIYFNAGEKTNFLDGGRVTPHQMITAFTQLINQSILMAFEVFNASPNQVRRLLAGESCEVTCIDQAHLVSARRQSRR